MTTIVGESVGELREDVPLKTGARHSSLCSCNERLFGGPRLITTAFAVLTVITTIALLVQIYYGDFQVVPHGSVASDNRECSEIGTSLLKRGGNAVDAAVAGAFCLSVTNPHTAGLDATGQVLIYNHRSRQGEAAIDFSDVKHTPKLVAALAYVHYTHGAATWKDCVMPSANLARRGFLVSKQFETAVRNARAENLWGPLEAGMKINLTSLADTLTKIAETPPAVLLANITGFHSTEILNSTFADYNVFVPSTIPGPQLLGVLRQVAQLNITSKNPDYIYKLAEFMRHNKNSTRGGTTTNVAVIDRDELYISLVIGMHAAFGSGVMNPDGFLRDVQNSSRSYSRIPFIVTDANFKCGRRIVSGANDLITATQLLANLLVDGENITSSIEFPRFNLLQDGSIGLEDAHRPMFSDAVIEQLRDLGTLQGLAQPYDSCNIVEKILDDLNSHSDSRGGGISSRF